MEWINRYAFKPKPPKTGSILQAFNKLAIEQDISFQTESSTIIQKKSAHTLQSFDEFSFTSSLQRTFKDNCFTYEPQEYNPETGIFLEFSIQLPTQYEQLTVVVDVEINLKLQYIRYRSYFLQNNQIFAYTHDQINTISKYLSTNVNPRNALGCMSIDNETGQIIYQTVNNSLGHLNRRIKKAPSELMNFIELEIKEIEKTWRNFLPNFFRAMSLSAVKNKNHPFWRNFKQKKSIYDSQEFLLLMEYVKQSYIEHPFMFDEEQEEKGKKVLKKIRSKIFNREQKNKKKAEYERMMSYKQCNSSKLKNDISNILQMFISPSTLDNEYKKCKYEISQDKKMEISNHLVVSNFQSKHCIYSPLEIREIKNERHLSKSGFSNLKILNVIAKKAEDREYTPNSIVSKQTQQTRFINQTEILKIIGKGKSLFITRFYFSQVREPVANESSALKDKILLQYCHLKSIDSYLSSHKKFIALETKLFFLYEIAVGIRFLRDYGISHNDLKPQNVLLKIMADKQRLNSTFMLRLIDFGQSYSNIQTPINMKNRYKRGFTIPYASPQQTMKDRYTEKNDIFSFGVMLYEIVFDNFPVQIVRKGKQIYISEQNYLKFYAIAPEKCKYFSIPKIMQVLYHLCLRCINPQPIHRPAIDWIVALLKQTLLFIEKVYLYRQ